MIGLVRACLKWTSVPFLSWPPHIHLEPQYGEHLLSSLLGYVRFALLLVTAVHQSPSRQTRKHLKTTPQTLKIYVCTSSGFIWKKTRKRNDKSFFLTVAWTPPVSAYSWPQINLAGKYNPPLYGLPGLWACRDAMVWWQSAANERLVFFFLYFFFLPPVLHGNGRQEKSSIMQVAISASPGPADLSLFLSLQRGLTCRGPCESSQRRRISPGCLCLSVLTVFISLPSVSLSFPDTNHSHSCTKRSSSVPVHLLDKCEQNVNSFQSTLIQHTLLGRGGREVKRSTVDNTVPWRDRSSHWAAHGGVGPFSSG